MVWGRTNAARVGGDGRRGKELPARRYAHAGDIAVDCETMRASVGEDGRATQDSPIPQSASCSRCEQTAILAEGKLPKGWLLVEGEAVCADCAWSRRTDESQHQVSTPRHVAIGNEGTRYGGCRVTHEVVRGGFVNLGIRGGWRPPDSGRDDAARFMLNAKGLDELIIHLSKVREGMRNG